jgi:DNA-binding transcriptional regulator LsrR (DeoR family)
VLAEAPSLEQTVRAWHDAGTSQRAIARQLSIDRRKAKRIIDQVA